MVLMASPYVYKSYYLLHWIKCNILSRISFVVLFRDGALKHTTRRNIFIKVRAMCVVGCEVECSELCVVRSYTIIIT